MDSNQPNLRQYFGDSNVPPASQFFDEIGDTAADMIQSIYLGENEAQQTTTANIFPQDMSASFSQQRQELFTSSLPDASSSTSITTSNLPDPSTFFDTIESETRFSMSAAVTDSLVQAMDVLNVKTPQVDKEADRRTDAWIPDPEAKKTLMKVQAAPQGSFMPDWEELTKPGLVLEEELTDALHEVAVKYLGVSSAGSRGVKRAEHVSCDESGLQELVRTGYLRAAVNLTGTLINNAGQGVGKMNRPSKHSPRSLQLWLTRFTLMVKIKLHDVLAKEIEPFGDFGKPDMYYQFYPENYGGRRGSMVPFSLRLLAAEAPAHLGTPEKALIPLFKILHVVKQMLSNLCQGRAEDGEARLQSEQDRNESIKLWTARKTRVMHSIINCLTATKDYRSSMCQLLIQCEDSKTVQESRALKSALCRVCLQAGQVTGAIQFAQAATADRHQICATPDLREYVDQGLIEIALGKYQEAYNSFLLAADQEPTNIMVANNIAVCLLYMGMLKEAIAVLQKAIESDPERGLNESLLINLCTLYELESSKTHDKKLHLLRMLCKYKSDTLPNVLECLKLS